MNMVHLITTGIANVHEFWGAAFDPRSRPVVQSDMKIPGAGKQPSGKGPAESATGQAHIAIQEALDGPSMDWIEHVSGEQHGAWRPNRR